MKLGRRTRRGTAGVVASVIMFAILFSVGTGYFIFVNATNAQYVRGLVSAANRNQAAGGEALQITTLVLSNGDVGFYANNTSSEVANLTAVYVQGVTGGLLKCAGIGLPASAGCANTTPPLWILVNSGKGSPKIDTGYLYVAGTTDTLVLLTARGNHFSQTYPDLNSAQMANTAQSLSVNPATFKWTTIQPSTASLVQSKYTSNCNAAACGLQYTSGVTVGNTLVYGLGWYNQNPPSTPTDTVGTTFTLGASNSVVSPVSASLVQNRYTSNCNAANCGLAYSSSVTQGNVLVFGLGWYGQNPPTAPTDTRGDSFVAGATQSVTYNPPSPSLVQSRYASNCNSANCALAYSSSVTAGNTLVLGLGWYGGQPYVPVTVNNCPPPSIVLDGNNYNTGTGSTLSASLSTAHSNDVVIAVVTGQNTATGTYQTPSISDGSSLTWNARSSEQQVSSVGGYSYYGQVFYAIATSTLSSDSIMITWNSAPTHYATLQVFGVTGANTATPFDSHSGLPAFASGAYASVTTSNTNDFIYGAELTATTGSPTVGSGFTGIESGVGSSIASEYKIVSSAQSGLSVSFSNSGSDADGSWGDAIQVGTGCGSGVISFDGATGANTESNSVSASLTTSSSNDVIILGAGTSSSSASVSSVSDAGGHTWTHRATETGSSSVEVEEWYTTAASPLSSDSITVTWSASGDNTFEAFGISGANTATPFDGNSGLAAKATGTTTSPSVSVSTSNANDIVFGLLANEHTSSSTCHTETVGNGFTDTGAAQSCAAGTSTSQNSDQEYEIVSTTQTNLALSFTTSSGGSNQWAMIGDAVVAGTGSATPTTFQQKVVWNPSTYSSYEASDLGNVRFCADTACATPLYAWLESCSATCGTSATSATAWVKLTSSIANGGTATIYMVFKATSVEFDGNYWGEAPTLSGTYGQYDNGANVFNFYDGFAGTSLSAKWTTISSTGAGGVLALDGSCSSTSTTTSVSCSLTTTSANDVIYVAVTTKSGSSLGVSGAGLTWAQRGSTTSYSNIPANVGTFYAAASSALSSQTITASATGATNMVIEAFGISGANTGSPFDPNASVPGSSTGSGATSSTSISTSNANDFIIGFDTDNSGSVGSVGSGYTLIKSGYSGAASLTEYKVVSATQSNLAVTASPAGGSGAQWGMWADSVQAAPTSLALDGHATGDTNTASASATLTTTNGPDVIYAVVSGSGNPSSLSVSGGSLTWNQRGSTVSTPTTTCSNCKFAAFYAIATGALSSASITATCTGATGCNINVFGISGANTGSPFDSHSGLPASATGTSGGPTVSISTTNANDFIIGAEGDDAGTVGSQGSGYTLIGSKSAQVALNTVTEYKTVSSSQSNLAVTATAGTTPAPTGWVMWADAIQQVSSSSCTVTVNNGATFTTANSNAWCFVYSAAQTYPQVAESYMVNAPNNVDPMLGVSTTASADNWVGLYQGYSIDKTTLHTYDSWTYNAGASSSGWVANPSQSSFPAGIWTVTWAATGSEYFQDGAGNSGTYTDNHATIGNYFIYVGQSNDAAGSNVVDWARMRAYPPSNVMPSINFGSVSTANAVPTISDTLGDTYSLGVSSSAAAGLYYVPVTLTNNQNSATASTMQQMITWNPSSYSTYEAADLGNIRLCTTSACTTQLYGWLESCTASCGTSATSATAWVKLTSSIGANGGSQIIYMVFQSTSTEFDGNYWGEAPQLSGTYGQYDNGANVFTFYDGFVGSTLSSTNWQTVINTGGSITQNNGLTISASSTTYNPMLVSKNTYSPAVEDASMQLSPSQTTGSTPGIFYATTLPTSSGGDLGFQTVYRYDWCKCTSLFRLLDDISGSYSSGTTTSYSLPSTYNVWSATWSATGNEVLAFNYAAQLTWSNSGISYGSAYIGAAATQGGQANLQWLRLRAYPPSGVMPSLTLGSVSNTSPTTYNSYIWYASAASTGANTITATFSSAVTGSVSIYELQGYTTAGVQTSTGSSSSGSTSLSVTSFTPATNSFVIGNAESGSGSSTFTAGSGFSLVSTCNSAYGCSEYKSGVGSATTVPMSLGASALWAESAISFAPATGGTYYSYIWYATAASSGADTITASFSQAVTGSVSIYEFNGLTTAGVLTSTGSSATGSGSASVTSMTPSAGSVVVGNTEAGSTTFTAGSGYTLSGTCGSVYGCGEYQTGVGSATTVPISLSPAATWVDAAVVFAPKTNTYYSYVWWGAAGASGTDTITATFSQSVAGSVSIYELNGYSTSGITTSTGSLSGGSTTPAVTAFTPGSNSIVIGNAETSSSSFTAGTGFTQVGTCSSVNGCSEDQAGVSASTTAPMTLNPSASWTEVAIAFRAGPVQQSGIQLNGYPSSGIPYNTYLSWRVQFTNQDSQGRAVTLWPKSLAAIKSIIQESVEITPFFIVDGVSTDGSTLIAYNSTKPFVTIPYKQTATVYFGAMTPRGTATDRVDTSNEIAPFTGFFALEGIYSDGTLFGLTVPYPAGEVTNANGNTSPAAGLAGTTVTASCNTPCNFNANSNAFVGWIDSTGHITTLKTFTMTSSGNLPSNLTFQIPTASPGYYTIIISDYVNSVYVTFQHT